MTYTKIIIFLIFLSSVNVAYGDPDLTVSDITWNPQNPSVGSSAAFTVTIKNIGTENSPVSYVNYYIDGTKSGYGNTNSISPGGSTTTTFNWMVQAGSHSIKAVIDPDSRITESDETNNEKTISFTGVPSDLTISDITWNPQNPLVGGSATFTVTIKNNGDGSSLNSYVNYYIDGTKSGYGNTNSISPGGSTTTTFNWMVQAGNHSIKAVIDPDNKITESDENNNEKEINFNGIPSDLKISDITWASTNPPVGSSETFTVTIKNQGDGDALNSYVNYYIDGTKLGYSSVGGISAGGSTTTTFRWTIQAGNHSIKAVIDPDNKITESDETNNDNEISFIGMPPDLIISSITWNPQNPPVGGSATFTVTIKNQGSGDALNSYVNYYIDGTKTGYGSISSIAPTGSMTTNFNWIIQTGSHSIKAIIDPDSKISESDETNNEKEINFNGVPSDLIISDIAWSQSGNSVTFTVTINNQGSGDSLSSYINYYIDGTKIGYNNINGISAGGTSTATVRWQATQGSHTFKAIVDQDNKISEKDETNNEKAIDIDISLAPETNNVPVPITTRRDIIQPTPKIIEATDVSISLTGEKTDIELGEDIIFKLSVVNFISKPIMNFQVIIKPPSGMSVTSTEFVKTGINQYSANYTLEPGDSKGIEVTVRPNQIGDFNIDGIVVYYFGEDKDKIKNKVLGQPIKVRNNNQESQRSSGPSKTPTTSGFEFILVPIVLILIKFFLKRN